MIDAVALLYSVIAALLPAPAANAPAASAPALPIAPSVVRAIAQREGDAPDVNVWILGSDQFRRGDVARVEFRASDDAYVTVVRVDTDGRLRVLWPLSPFDDNWVERGRTYKVPGRNGGTFTVDDYTGLGYVFAIASYDRFNLQRFEWRGGWDERQLGGNIHGDPFVAVDNLAERLLWDDRSPYSTAYAEYYVERHVDYPRYVCYDCHHNRGYAYWDPYAHYCSRFRIVIWSDPYYYPYRYYPGTRVIYVRRPRYEFKEATRDEPITRTTAIEHRRRDDGVDRRRPGSPTSDPNLPVGGRRRTGDDGGRVAGAGGTRPGDDIPSGGSRPGRRRGQEADGPGNSNDAPGHTGDRGPRREPGNPGGGSPGDNGGVGGGNGGQGGNPGAGNPDHPRPPRGEGRGNGEGGSNGGNPGNGGNGGNAGSSSDDSSWPIVNRGQPRREPGTGNSGAPDERGGANRGRRDAGDDRRSSDASRDGGWDRAIDRERRSEPRSEPKSEPRSEPRRESSADRGRSSGSNSGSGNGGSSRSSGNSGSKSDGGSRSSGSDRGSRGGVGRRSP